MKDKLGWGGGVWDRLLSTILVLAIIGALGMLAYVIVIPRTWQSFTEFYFLGLSDKAEGYPSLLRVGEEGKVVVGIVNREYEMATYRVEVRIDGIISNEVAAVTLEPNEQWQEVVGFTPDKVGDKQKVEFLLYKQGQTEVYQRLHLWLDVQ